MLSKEDNELITDTSPGTPMGELFRRFWLPVALASELPGADCVPLRVRVLGEDLIPRPVRPGRECRRWCLGHGAKLPTRP